MKLGYCDINKDKFLMMKFPFELTKDTFIQSIEFVPGNNQIVHHINAHLITYDERKKNIFDGERIIDTELFSDSIGFTKLDLFNDDGSIPTFSRSVSNYLPGSVQTMYPNGIGINIGCIDAIDPFEYEAEFIDMKKK